MGVLDNLGITGVKPKQQPTARGMHFNKNAPMDAYNCPLPYYHIYKIYGWKWRDNLHVLKNFYWLVKQVPAGRPITPEMFGLDGIYSKELLSMSKGYSVYPLAIIFPGVPSRSATDNE